MTNTGSISANPFTQPIEENPARVEQRAAEQDPQTKDVLEGEFEDSENEELTGTPEVLNPSPEGFADIPHRGKGFHEKIMYNAGLGLPSLLVLVEWML